MAMDIAINKQPTMLRATVKTGNSVGEMPLEGSSGTASVENHASQYFKKIFIVD